MCGIAGIYNIKNKQVNQFEIESLIHSIKHRGPDGDGYWLNQEKNLALVHVRLSIIDLSINAKQPMISIGDRYVISFNGEIYNFIELKKELTDKGYYFKTQSDTEVIIAAFDFWGADCLNKFNGMWAFAIYDNKTSKLFLARDRFGIKPLYYYKNSEQFAFASETLAFKHLIKPRRSLDANKLKIVLQNNFALEGNGVTIFKDIYQICPGHYIEISQDLQLVQKRWWNTLDNLQEIPNNFEEQIDQFKELFFDSCRLRLRSDVPIATALSGGLDSSSVYSTIKYLAKKGISKERLPEDWQTAFVATFPGAENDEREFAELVIKGVDGKGIFTQPDNTNLIDQIVSTTTLFDSIYLTPISVVVDVYKAMGKNGYKVSLDGHGVDEMLYGYPHSLTNAYISLMNENQNFLAEDVKNTCEGLFLSKNTPTKVIQPTSGSKSRIKKYIPKYALNVYRKIYNRTSNKKVDGNWINFQQIDFNENEFYPGFEQLSNLDKGIFGEFHLTTLPTILRNFDRASMQNGIEIRMPFMDWRLVSYIFSLPFSLKVGEGYTKLILRHAMKGIIPEPIRLRKTKIGFNAPMPMWFSNQLKTFIHDEINSRLFSQSNIWDAKKIKSFVKEKSKYGWTWNDCNQFWPYLNAHLIMKD